MDELRKAIGELGAAIYSAPVIMPNKVLRAFSKVEDLAKRTNALPVGIQEALNSGDGTYRP